jgi:hypothetical protein
MEHFRKIPPLQGRHAVTDRQSISGSYTVNNNATPCTNDQGQFTLVRQ